MRPVSEAGPAVTPPGRLALGLAAVLLAADQAVKAWILYGLDLPTRVSVPVLGPLKLTMVWNEGVSFGFLQATHDLARWGLTAFALVVARASGFALAAWGGVGPRGRPHAVAGGEGLVVVCVASAGR